MVDNIFDLFMECICDNYCKCEKCKDDDAPCYLEDDLKAIMRKELKEYLN